MFKIIIPFLALCALAVVIFSMGSVVRAAEILGPPAPGEGAAANTEILGPPAPGEAGSTNNTAPRVYTNPLHIPDYSKFSTPDALIAGIIDILARVISLAAFIGLLYGGIKYITADGADNTAAKKTVISSVIALVIGMLSYALIQIVYLFLQ